MSAASSRPDEAAWLARLSIRSYLNSSLRHSKPIASGTAPPPIWNMSLVIRASKPVDLPSAVRTSPRILEALIAWVPVAVCGPNGFIRPAVTPAWIRLRLT